MEAKPRRILHANASGILSTNPAFFPPQTSRHRAAGGLRGKKMRSHIPHPYHAWESHAWLSFRASSATTWQVCRVANWRASFEDRERTQSLAATFYPCRSSVPSPCPGPKHHKLCSLASDSSKPSPVTTLLICGAAGAPGVAPGEPVAFNPVLCRSSGPVSTRRCRRCSCLLVGSCLRHKFFATSGPKRRRRLDAIFISLVSRRRSHAAVLTPPSYH